jgi:pimeloyl-ACP methyl ester carboxylesterase
VSRPSPIAISFDVTAASPTSETLHQDGWLFLPVGTDPVSVVVCLAGGTYDRRYWHLEVLDHPGYSLAAHLSDAGHLVVAVDHVGVGTSSDPRASGPVGLELLAACDAEVVRQLQFRARAGTLHDSLPPFDRPAVGLGHSMGAAIAVVAQATTGVFDALVLLGHSLQPLVGASVAEVELAVDENLAGVRGVAGVAADVEVLEMARPPLRDVFYAADVPEAVVIADEAAASRLPARAAAETITNEFVARFAPEISVPILLGFGASADLSPDPHREPANYPASSDVTLFLLEGSAHCHNFSSRRVRLWDRIDTWIRGIR